MARNGSGTYSLPATMAPANTVSSSSTVNSIMSDVADALTDSINKDGTKAFAANQSMGSNKLTSLANGTAATDAANAGQVQAGLLNWADAGGTADAITASYTPAVTSVSDGQLFYVRAAAANATTTPTFTPNSGTVTARTIVKHGNVALAAGDINGDGHELELRYRASDTKYELLNPKGSSYTVNGQTEETAPAVGDFLGGYDISGTAERKFTIGNVFKTITGLTAETAVAVDDELPLYDTSAGTGDKATVQNVLKAINGLTEDTSPDRSADFILTYDTSASDVKKVKPSNLASNRTLLATHTTTSGTTHDVTFTAGDYNEIYCEFEGVSFTASATLAISFSSNGGSSYSSTGVSVGPATGGAANTVTGICTVRGINQQVTTSGTDTQFCWVYPSSRANSTDFSTIGRGWVGTTTGPVNGVRFQGGTFDAGTIRVYGVK